LAGAKPGSWSAIRTGEVMGDDIGKSGWWGVTPPTGERASQTGLSLFFERFTDDGRKALNLEE